MDKRVLKKILFVLSILFTVLTLAGAVYVIIKGGQVSPGYSVVPMVWSCIFTSSYRKVKKELESKE